MIHKWDVEDKTVKQKCIDAVVTRLQEIEDLDRVGIVAAQDIIDIVAEIIAPEIYNKALSDVNKMLHEKFIEIEYKIDDLKQS